MLTTFLVNNAGDFTDSDPNVTTLREAINFANVDGDPDTITFAPTLNGQTILLTQGALPTITESVTIDASSLSNGITIDAGNGTDDTFGTGDGFRIFNIELTAQADEQITVTLDSLTITGGTPRYACAV